jgi:lipopolysaccharide export system protein LptA
MCQKKSKVNLISSTKSEGIKLNGVDVIKVYNGVWTQDASRMKSDSAYFYQAQNAFDAFGHVNINQGDTLNIYSDKLNYNGNTKIAILTDNVKMVDKDATLTTNFFTYNTATKIGTYTDGGKLVSKTNTLVSKNGYYFAGSHDAYFRYNVVSTTNDAIINTDTMRYNSQSRINYFYGPTTIYGAKDKDTLLTDNGTYDTKTEIALFTKNNLYKQGTKSLVGDTLYYDRLKGYGRAVKHVTFNDNEQKVTIKGGLGTYFKSNDLAIVTRDPYIILVTDDKDTTKKDTAHKPVSLPPKNEKAKNNKPPGKVKTAPPVKSQKGQTALIDSVSKQLTMPVIDSFSKKTLIDKAAAQDLTMPVIDSFSKKIPKKMSVDSAGKLLSAQSKKLDKNTRNKITTTAKELQKGKLDTGKILSAGPVKSIKDTSKVKRDSVYMSADTIETQIMTYKDLDSLQREERLAHIIDTSKNAVKHIVYKKSPKALELSPPKMAKDTSFWHRDYFGPPKRVAAKPKKDKDIVAKVKKIVKIDSTFLDRHIAMKDTARVRIIMAFHSAKIFKSDLQAIADSIFYSNSDSTIRCYKKPMVWTQGSQLSGDTINLLLKNKKLDKMDMFPNAFIVNVEKTDSAHFNQVGGKKMRGFFRDGKLSRVIIDGNVESIYFARDSTTHEVTDMNHSISSRMRLILKDNEVTDLAYLTKDDHSYTPINKVKEDEKILKGFIWKPKDRPISKESILPSYNRKPDTTKKAMPTKPAVAGEPRGKKMYSDGKAGNTGKKTMDVKAAADSTGKKSPGITAGKDTTAMPKVLPGAPLKKDSTQNLLKKDTTGIKPSATGSQPVKKDTTGVKLPPLNKLVIKKDTTGNK